MCFTIFCELQIISGGIESQQKDKEVSELLSAFASRPGTYVEWCQKIFLSSLYKLRVQK